jgi:putative transposase
MSHSLYKNFVHLVWTTKLRKPLLFPEVEAILYPFMEQQFIAQGCMVYALNGCVDHVHVLIKLNPNKALADVVKQVKGSSSHYVNQQSIIKQRFLWQTGYAAFSTSRSILKAVTRYIQNQKEHHIHKTYLMEYHEFEKLSIE